MVQRRGGVRARIRVGGRGRRCRISLRHDLSPKEASQVVRFIAGDVAVRHQDVLPAVVIQVGEQRAPGPAAHFDTGAAPTSRNLPSCWFANSELPLAKR